MKKIFALALAGVMTAGMTTVAFAETKNTVIIGYGNDGFPTDNYYVISDGVAKVHDDQENVEGGDEIAIPLVVWENAQTNNDADDNYYWYRDTDDAKKPNIYTDWRIGKAETDLEMVKFDLDGDNKGDEYIYAVVVTVPENDTNKEIDLEGKIMVGRTKSAAEENGIFNLGVTYSPAAEKVYVYDGETLEAGKSGIYKFDENGEIDIEFGDQALFTVDVTGQGKLNLAWNTDFDREFANKYDYANIDFVTFEGKPTFNKTGVMYIYADRDEFVYEVTEDGAKEIKGLEWNDDYEAWEFKTRTLKSYAISDVELDEKTVTEDKNESSKPAGDKENPDTGR